MKTNSDSLIILQPTPPTIKAPALAWLMLAKDQAGDLKNMPESAPIWEALKAEYRQKFGREMDSDMKKYLKGES